MPDETSTPPSLGRWPGIAGLAFCALVVAGFVIQGSPAEASADDAAILKYYTDSGNQLRQVIGAALIGAGLLCFLGFLVGLRSASTKATGSDAPLPALAFASGVVYVALFYVSVAVGTSLSAAESDVFELDPDTARVVLTIGNFWLFGFAAMAASPLVGATSLVSRRTGLLPPWLTWAGFVVAVLLLPAPILYGLPMALFLLWALATSIVLLRSLPRQAQVVTGASS